MWLTGQRESIRFQVFVFIWRVCKCVCVCQAGVGLCNVIFLRAVVGFVLYHQRSCASSRISIMWGVVHYPEPPKLDTLLSFFCALTPFQLPSYHAYSLQIHTPPAPATQHGHLQPIREKEAACAANDWDQIKTINHSVLQEDFINRSSETGMHVACQPTCDGL